MSRSSEKTLESISKEAIFFTAIVAVLGSYAIVSLMSGIENKTLANYNTSPKKIARESRLPDFSHAFDNLSRSFATQEKKIVVTEAKPEAQTGIQPWENLKKALAEKEVPTTVKVAEVAISNDIAPVTADLPTDNNIERNSVDKASAQDIAIGNQQAETDNIADGAHSGDCLSELGKYDWPQDKARKIMMAESGNVPTVVNDNPSTGDYSVGCFQVNLKDELRKTRPSEAWLKKASNNVKYANGMYNAQGRTFCKTSGWYTSCKRVGIDS